MKVEKKSVDDINKKLESLKRKKDNEEHTYGLQLLIFIRIPC